MKKSYGEKVVSPANFQQGVGLTATVIKRNKDPVFAFCLSCGHFKCLSAEEFREHLEILAGQAKIFKSLEKEQQNQLQIVEYLQETQTEDLKEFIKNNCNI